MHMHAARMHAHACTYACAERGGLGVASDDPGVPAELKKMKANDTEKKLKISDAAKVVAEKW